MRKNILSFLILLSLVLIEVHGFAHFAIEDYSEHETHHCLVCEIDSHRDILESGLFKVYLEVPFIIFKKNIIAESIFQSKKIKFRSSRPRAPPIV